MTAVKLREWRKVKPVAGPCGVAITTRLRTTPDDERVRELVAAHLGRLRRADLARVSRRSHWIRAWMMRLSGKHAGTDSIPSRRR